MSLTAAQASAKSLAISKRNTSSVLREPRAIFRLFATIVRGVAASKFTPCRPTLRPPVPKRQFTKQRPCQTKQG